MKAPAHDSGIVQVRNRVILLAAVLAMAAAGCQNSVEYGIRNMCDETIRIQVSTGSDLDEAPVTEIAVGQPDLVFLASENSRTVFLAVRTATHPEVRNFSVAVADLAEPDDEADYDLEIVFGGPDCTPQLHNQ